MNWVFARFDGTNISFHTYSFDHDTFSNLAVVSHNTNSYGVPSGLDFVRENGNLRMLVATKDAPGEMPWDPAQNYILDIGAHDGSLISSRGSMGDL